MRSCLGLFGRSHCLNVLPLRPRLGEASLVRSYLSLVELSEEVLHVPTVHSNGSPSKPCAALEQWA